MSAQSWQLAETPAALLNLLEERGEQRRLRLIACRLFRGILASQ